MKKILLLFFGIFISVAFTEIVLRFLPTASGMQNPAPTKNDPLIHYYPNDHFCYSHGWNFRNSVCESYNNFGYASNFNYSTTQKTIAVIGDSFVEALMIRGNERLHERINSALDGKYQAIGLGISGADLSDYLITSEYVTKNFDVSGLVFLLNDGDITGATNPRLRGFWFKQGANGIEIDHAANVKMRNIFYMSSVLSYLYENLKFNPKDVFSAKAIEKKISDVSSSPGDDVLPNVRYVINFLEQLKSLCESKHMDPQRVIFLIDADRKAIYENRSGETLAPELIKLISSYGFQPVNLDSVFRNDWKNNRKAFDFGSVDSHWNSYAHSLIATYVVSLLNPTD
jgi:hypothetical protein